jgi:glycosyltransferase involved in cell wall biosynthesis
MKNIKKFTIVIPVLNEEKIICEVISTISQLQSLRTNSYQLLFIDDGSTDDTWQLLSSISRENSNVSAIKLSRNFGKDNALFVGLSASQSEFTITIDCDGQHPFSLIDRFVEITKESSPDIVHAVKKSRVPSESRLYGFLVRTYSNFLSGITGLKLLNATECKMISNTAKNAIISCGDAEFFIRALVPWVGFKQEYISFETHAGMRAGSAWNLYNLTRFASNGIILFSNFPMKLIVMIGLTLIAISIFIAIKIVVDYFMGLNPIGYTTLILLLMFNSGIIVFSIGVIGLYVKSILNQTISRPRAIISETMNFTLPPALTKMYL